MGMSELDEQLQKAGSRLVELIGYDQFAAVVKGFTAAYADAVARQAAGEELPDIVSLGIPALQAENVTPEVADLVGQFLNGLLKVAIRSSNAAQN